MSVGVYKYFFWDEREGIYRKGSMNCMGEEKSRSGTEKSVNELLIIEKRRGG